MNIGEENNLITLKNEQRGVRRKIECALEFGGYSLPELRRRQTALRERIAELEDREKKQAL
ncbi:MAG: hypothetical protein ACOC6Q_03120 [Patescibacteria group bacterium]